MQNSFLENLIETGEAEDDDDLFPTYDQVEEDVNDQSNATSLLNIILSGVVRLNALLPTATILAFTLLHPLITNDGQCTSLTRWIMGCFLALTTASCMLFPITDSFRTATGRLYHGVATMNGIWTICGGHVKPCVTSDFRLRWSDLFYLLLSLIAFLTFAAAHSDVLSCYNVDLPQKMTIYVPLVVGFLICAVYVIFPSRRKGIGYPFMLQNDLSTATTEV
ncbi:hypothetical protein DCAR_0623470 [Daucus carota subsp. sativus]|uniref:Uncharacterized protein n=1 Tax=Daucus carota subsp. sativus TaxID=79200 RepID=A0A175YBX4_DAUCS|nr:PREDICTED: uncharacterized protein LOC108192741 [Daucus carota subsp. sativus]WOH04064.1 hypothetical protein DCAR_0623470 [Daucus carota subsp. sativus]